MLNNFYNKFRRITSNQVYFPEIDGIRFVAIILVVLFHAHGYFLGKSGISAPDSPIAWGLDAFLSKGDRGMELFFVLSGFILCMPFAHHYINAGKKIMLKKYYMRRVTRLEPPYILAITGIFLLQLLMHVNADKFTLTQQFQHYFASLTYTHGIIYHSVPIITVVTWSLEIEIQFYLLAPLLFKILQLPVVPRRLLLSAAILGIVALQHVFMPQELVFTIYRLIQYFMAGILLTDFYVSGSLAALFDRKFIIPIFLALFAAICIVPFKDYIALQLLFPFMIATFYYMIMKNNAIKKVFSYKFIPIIGGMCYSIYLLHYTIISIFGRFTMKLRITDQYLPNLLFQLAILTVLALGISSIFYLFVERPFMDQKWTNKLMKKDIKHEETNMQS